MRRAADTELCSPSLLLAAACVAFLASAAAPWSLERTALLAGETWRLWTAHVVHYSARHALLDALVVAMCGRIAEHEFGRLFVGMTLLVGAAAVSLVCIAATDMHDYRGASALAALLGVMAAAAVWRTLPDKRWVIATLGTGWFAKCTADVWLPQLTLSALPHGVRVAWPAHLAGVGVAALSLLLRAAWIARAIRPLRRAGPRPCGAIRRSGDAAARASGSRTGRSAGAI